jgi:hypothetical protein
MEVEVGMKVPFYITDDGPVHPAAFTAEMERSLDRFHYWDEYVYPPWLRLLDAAYPYVAWKVFGQRPKNTNTAQPSLFGGNKQFVSPPPVRRRPTTEFKGTLLVHFPEDSSADRDVWRLKRLREICEVFEGPVRLCVQRTVRVDGSIVEVDLATPLMVRLPEHDSRFIETLRTIGITRWTYGSDDLDNHGTPESQDQHRDGHRAAADVPASESSVDRPVRRFRKVRPSPQ